MLNMSLYGSFVVTLMTTGTLLAAEAAPGIPVLPTPEASQKPVVDASLSTYPIPGKAEDMGKGIQATMMLLATSTPQKHNKVKVLVYGQSISEQNWWKLVNEDLRKRFPEADLVMENRAIGGFASQLLINPLQHDVYTFYPDLVIFHVYVPTNSIGRSSAGSVRIRRPRC